MIRVAIAYPRDAFLRDYEKEFLPFFRDGLQQNEIRSGFTVEDDPSRADLIILLQSAEYKTLDYIRVLENDPLIQRHAERVYVIDYDDHPEGLLAGLYTSIEQPFFDPELHRVWPILFMNNDLVYGMNQNDLWKSQPKRLFSFAGAASHEVRERLFTLFSESHPEYQVQRVDKWYNHNNADRRTFVEMALDSLFCLCPRGYTSYTNRICEVMAMGRAPVIIADDWLPFSFEEQQPYYIRVSEKEIQHLPELLNARRAEAQEMGKNARQLWEKYCSPDRRVVAAAESISRLAARPGVRPTFNAYRERWHSPAFLRKCGWTLRQRMALKVRQRLQRSCLNRLVPSQL